MRQYFKDAEKGLEVLAEFKSNEISLDIPGVGVPDTAWRKNGWELLPSVLPRVRLICVLVYWAV